MLCAGLQACQTTKPAIEYRYLTDLPDAALVIPCDTSERDVVTNGDMADELSRTREQRDTCAGQVRGLATWRAGAVERGKTN